MGMEFVPLGRVGGRVGSRIVKKVATEAETEDAVPRLQISFTNVGVGLV